MAKQEAKKILRVGIIQGGKIIEEKLLRKRETVTIGQSPKNTFYVPISKLPKSLTLFEVKAEKIHLVFNDEINGRVSYQEKVHSLQELRGTQQIQRKGNLNYLALDEKSRGKVVLGDITLLFQFVPPPPVVPKPQLPASAKGGLGQALMAESAFLLALLGSLVLHIGWVSLSIVFQTPEDKNSKKNVLLHSLNVDVQFDKEEDVPEPDAAPEEDPEEDDANPAEEPVAAEPEPQPEKKPEKKPEKVVKRQPKPQANPKDKEAQKRRRQAQIRNKTILKHITSSAMGGTAGPDALRQGHQESLADAFKPVGGLTVGKPGDVAGFRGGPKLEGEAGAGPRVQGLSTGERGGKRLKTGKVAKTAKKPEKKVKLNIGLRGGKKTGGMGKLDGTQVSKVMRRRSSAFRACYESRLKVNPGLKGKVVIRFTIGTAGRITNIKVAQNSTGDSAVGSCIINKVRRWRFSPPENGSVTFTYPIVLSKG